MYYDLLIKKEEIQADQEKRPIAVLFKHLYICMHGVERVWRLEWWGHYYVGKSYM